MQKFKDRVKKLAKLISKPIVVFDLETTDKFVNSSEIVQFAAIRVEPDGKTSDLQFICKPSMPIAPEASKIHGIDNKRVEKEKPFKAYIDKIKKIFKDADVAGFNLISFDVKILDRQLEENGVKNFFDGRNVYDAYIIFCKQFSRKLGDAKKIYTNEEIVDAHDAMADVKATLEVMCEQISQAESSIDELIEETKKPSGKNDKDRLSRYILFDKNNDPILAFSKHKGTKVKDLDQGFIDWVLKRDFPDEVKDVLKNYRTKAR